ncbi:MAG: hypothetical protein FWF51_06525 [Chitinivibrionia bacterium]|nr:hypothetical protein [Chitinivibrionia bacterium]
MNSEQLIKIIEIDRRLMLAEFEHLAEIAKRDREIIERTLPPELVEELGEVYNLKERLEL